MVSARVMAYGAVVAAGLALLAPSGTARTVSKMVETNQATKVAKGQVRTAKRKAVRVGRSAANARRKVAWAKQAGKPRAAQRARHAKWASAKDRGRSAQLMVQQRRGITLASASSQSPTSDSAIQRRFRGFIAPVPMSSNNFEMMRKPRLDGSHLAPTIAIAPVTQVAMVAPSIVTAAAPSAEPETTGSTGGAFQLASVDSVVVSEAPVSAAAQVVQSAKPAETPSNSLPLQTLFIALCGALTAASALRFAVGS